MTPLHKRETKVDTVISTTKAMRPTPKRACRSSITPGSVETSEVLPEKT